MSVSPEAASVSLASCNLQDFLNLGVIKGLIALVFLQQATKHSRVEEENKWPKASEQHNYLLVRVYSSPVITQRC